MKADKTTLANVLTIAAIVLAVALVCAQAIMTIAGKRADSVQGNLDSVQADLASAQAEEQDLQQQADSTLVQWRNAQGRLAYYGDESGKVCYLTFTGGPTTTLTQKNLDVLSEHGAVATWFCMGDEASVADLDVSLVSTIEAQGSAVGICGWSYSETYASYWGTLDEYFESDFDLAANALEQAAGHEIDICRLPGTSTTVAYYNSTLAYALPQELLARGYQYFDYNVASGDDVDGATADDIVQNVLDAAQVYAKSDSPICVALTDATGNDATTKALDAIITGLSELGYSFETLDVGTAGFYRRSIVTQDDGE